MHRKANISFSRRSSSDSIRDRFVLTLEDARSGSRVIEVMLTGEQLANMLTGLYQSDINVQYGALDNVGKVKQSRSIIIDMPKRPKEMTYEFANALLEEQHPDFFADGWRVLYTGDLGNPHRLVVDYGYDVSIMRFIPDPELEMKA